MRRHLTPWRAVGGIVVLLLLTVLILARIPSGKILLLPDAARPLTPLVHVQGGHSPPGGSGVYYVDVREPTASELDVLFPWLHPHGTFVPKSEIVPPCSSAEQEFQASLEEMAVSQRVGAAVALRQLGYHVAVHPNGVIVSQLVGGTNAPCRLQPMDVIRSVDGTRTRTLAKLRAVLDRVKPGQVVTLTVKRGDRTLTVHVRTIDDRGHALVGFAPAQAARITLPIRVSINLPRVGGPSAGLAFALEVMEKLGRNVVPHGYRVAATGEMELDGRVAPIGGVKQKTYGVRQAGADVFLVPAGGGNAAVARRYAGPLRIIAVHSLKQALHALATLPRTQ